MVARIWQGKTINEHSDIYKNIIEERDIPNYRKTKGFIKLTFLKRNDNQFTYFKLLTFWEDLDVIKNFTGANLEKAVSYKEDGQYLVDFPGDIMHYEVFAE